MNTVTRTAWANIRHNRSKNLLIGIAIVLTTLLLFLIPSIGYNMIALQIDTINKVYPTWHALYRGVDDTTAKELKSRNDIKTYGLRSDVGVLATDAASVSMMYLDESCLQLNRMELAAGHMPEEENEIVVSRGILDLFGSHAKIGDTITLPYQVYNGEGLDYAEEGSFVVSGLIEDTEANLEKKMYTALVSEAFMRKEIPAAQINYRFYFKLNDDRIHDTQKLEDKAKEIGAQFGIMENDTNINKEYIGANYIDPAMLPGIIGIMLIVILAGVITIYSIYYISMIQRIQEYGKLRAIGTTKHQLHQIVLREGMLVAAAAIPVGLFAGSFMLKPIFSKFIEFGMSSGSSLADVMRNSVDSGDVSLLHAWVYLLAAAVTFLTVYLSLLKPMRIAGKISAIEAIRFQGGNQKKKHIRKGFESLNLMRLTRANLMRNKKRTMMTILTMSFTGILVVVVATVLSCADPKESANASSLGSYILGINAEENNKERPELAWKEIQKNNPLNDDIRAQIEAMDGVTYTDFAQQVNFSSSTFEEGAKEQSLAALPEKYTRELLEYVVEGSATYEELMQGDKVVVNETELRWNPGLAVGKTFTAEVKDLDTVRTVDLTIAAIVDPPTGFTRFGGFLIAPEGLKKLAGGQINKGLIIESKNKMDQNLAKQIEAIAETDERFGISSWEAEYNMWKSGMVMISYASSAFLIVLSVISITNLINTMINSIYARKKELGMMQAIGLSGRQMLLMLQAEGMFYTIGALVISLGLGSLGGYAAYLWAKKDGMFSIRFYHYPVEVVLIMAGVLVVVQILLSLLIGKSLKRQSLIERIRFSE